jgi:hypothetical protein
MNGKEYSHTIPRELVHKRSVSEVLVTSVRVQPGSWTCHAQLPRLHSFHSDTTGAQHGYHAKRQRLL